MNDSDGIFRKQEQRYLLLKALWEAAGGRERTNVDFMQVATQAGFEEREAEEIYNYFWGEGFFANRVVRWGVSLSHAAILEIERSLTNPNEPTEHFSATVIQHLNFNAPVGAVQTGAGSTANVNQNIGANVMELLGLIDKLREQFQVLPPGTKEEAIDVVDGLAEELQRGNPRAGKIRAYLGQIKSFAGDVASGALATTLADGISKVLGIS